MSPCINRMIAGYLDDAAEMLERHGADAVYGTRIAPRLSRFVAGRFPWR
jgi:hypothetical protein